MIHVRSRRLRPSVMLYIEKVLYISGVICYNEGVGIRHQIKEVLLMDRKFFVCEGCGGITALVRAGDKSKDTGKRGFTKLEAGSIDAATEKHVPVYTVEGAKVSVKVGEVDHPMLEEHFIEFIAVSTDKGFYVRNLKAGEAPAAEFTIGEGETVDGVYAYCNLHGLWKA